MNAELYIDKQPVVLQENFSITIVEENPFVVKNGKYTYDITLSLLIPQNAKVYKHQNRINNQTSIPQDRSAYFVVDNEVVLNGTEVILEITDWQVKIQLVSGNSELNFLIGGESQLRDLDLGTADVSLIENNGINFWLFHEWSKESYPERDFQLLPYAVPGEDNLGNQHLLIHGEPGWSVTPPDISKPIYPFYLPTYSNVVPQPYFCAIIKRVIKAVGYKLEYNALETHLQFSQSYIVNGCQTLEYAKMLPEWTVSEFMSKIEMLFDCTFLVDEGSKTVKLLFNFQAFANGVDTLGGLETIDIDVYDEYTQEIDNENVLTVQNSNIEYDLDSHNSHKFSRLPVNALPRLKYVNFDFLSELKALVEDETDEFRFEKIFTDGLDEFMAYRTGEELNGKPVVVAKQVNAFKNLYNNPLSTEIDHSIDIIPAPMEYREVTTSWQFDKPLANSTFWIQVPVAMDHDPLLPNENTNPFPGTNEIVSFDLQNYLEGEIKDATVPSKIRLAIYAGLQKLDVNKYDERENINATYPMSYVESIAEYFEETQAYRWFGPIGAAPFRFKTFNDQIYSKSKHLDTTKTYKFSFSYVGKFNIMSKFIAKNKAFRCLKIERTVTNRGFDAIIKGEFYPYIEKS